ncbi:MAG: sigma 54-interacting transcriptional regulator [Pseudomonadota bacterium]
MVRFKAIDMGVGESDTSDLFTMLASPTFQTFFDKTSDGLMVLDAQDRVCAVNNAALQINGLQRGETLGSSLLELMEKSQLDWGSDNDGAMAKRRDFHSTSEDGRAILTSFRSLPAHDGQPALTIVTQRDLQVLDHMRRSASGLRGGNVFKFTSERDIVPDFEKQKSLSPNIKHIIERSTRALHQRARLLLLGESGTGKTELARYLHRVVGTREEPFIHVNCGAIPESLFESEMFGYEKGAFTGALQSGKKGLIESAEGGTLFLDEVGEIPLFSQAKLLKFLEDGMIQRLGGRSSRRINTRIVSATNRDLWGLVGESKFRRDLYYRLAVITIELTPLRDLPALTAHLIEHFVAIANRMRSPALEITPNCRQALLAYDFPGNIRELHNIIQHLSVVSNEKAEVGNLPQQITKEEPAGPVTSDFVAQATSNRELWQDQTETKSLKQLVGQFERDIIAQAISRHGSKRKAAKALGVDIGTIVRKTKVST